MTTRTILFGVCAALLVAAADDSALRYWSAQQLRGEQAKLSAQDPRTAFETLADFGSHNIMLAVRHASGQAELHEKMADVFVVRTGDATLVTGGPGLPEGVNKGFYVRPTVFADVTNDMTIAREEIFGPVIAILGAKDEADAVKIANDTPYGLAGYVSAGTVERARKVGRQIRAGNVNLQGVPNDRTAPFGGYKQSGNGREWGKYGLEDFLEVKAIAGFNAA